MTEWKVAASPLFYLEPWKLTRYTMLLQPHKAPLLRCKPRSLIILANFHVDVHSNKMKKFRYWSKKTLQSILQTNTSIREGYTEVTWGFNISDSFSNLTSTRKMRTPWNLLLQFAIFESCYCCNLRCCWRYTFDLISAWEKITKLVLKIQLLTCGNLICFLNSTWRVGSGTRYLQQYFTTPMAESSEMRWPTEV
jgi:hypothetical protein